MGYTKEEFDEVTIDTLKSRGDHISLNAVKMIEASNVVINSLPPHDEFLRVQNEKFGQYVNPNSYLCGWQDCEEWLRKDNDNRKDTLCDDWIHQERIRVNDDKYCPLCGEKLQA